MPDDNASQGGAQVGVPVTAGSALLTTTTGTAGDEYVDVSRDNGVTWSLLGAVTAPDGSPGGSLVFLHAGSVARAFSGDGTRMTVVDPVAGTVMTQAVVGLGGHLGTPTFADATHGWVVSITDCGSCSPVISATTDGGRTWAPLSVPAP